MILDLRQEQKQTLSPKMIQAASVLQMAVTQIDAFLTQQALENPVIDLAAREPEERDERDRPGKEEWVRTFDEQNRYLYHTVEAPDEDRPEWNIKTGEAQTLQEYLWEQALTAGLSETELRQFKVFIQDLDPDGYYRETDPDGAAPDGVQPEAVRIPERQKEAFRTLLRKMDPPGVGAASLAECLCIQLERKNLLTDEMRELVSTYLEQMARNRIPQIARSMGLPTDQVARMCSQIRLLDPKPGAHFVRDRLVTYVVPDAAVVKREEGLEVVLNDSFFPEVVINAGYRRMLEQSPQEDVKAYLEEKIGQAEWIRQCILRRNRTLYEVIRCVADVQSAFFRGGEAFLRPLTHAQVAAELGVHETTISRAVKNKYLRCSWGTYPLSWFFAKKGTNAEQKTGTEDVTAGQVKKELRRLIEGENRGKPLSDQKLADLLQQKGYVISRRTVAKYRAQENIPDAAGRKTY